MMLELISSDLSRAQEVLRTGKLCVIPTETVYGLGADATNASAVGEVFRAKGRPTNHPLIVHVASPDFVSQWFKDLPDWAHKLATELWPGPLTLVGPRTQLASNQVTGGQDTVAVRVPRHPLTTPLLTDLAQMDVPGIVAPSANTFGHVSPTSAAHAAADLGDYLLANDGMVLDGGPCQFGVESTIVLATGDAPQVLRPGGITRKMISDLTGLALVSPSDCAPRVPGALAAHYAPDAQVKLLEPQPEVEIVEGTGVIAPHSVRVTGSGVELSRPKTDEEFAHDLYAALRKADELGLAQVSVVLPGNDGLAEAIRDRLARAAHNSN